MLGGSLTVAEQAFVHPDWSVIYRRNRKEVIKLACEELGYTWVHARLLWEIACSWREVDTVETLNDSHGITNQLTKARRGSGEVDCVCKFLIYRLSEHISVRPAFLNKLGTRDQGL